MASPGLEAYWDRAAHELQRDIQRVSKLGLYGGAELVDSLRARSNELGQHNLKLKLKSI